jgi:hypothetical protein
MAQSSNQAEVSRVLPSIGSLIQQDESWKKALEVVSQSTGRPIAALLGNPAHPRDISVYLGSLKEAQKQSKLSRTCRAVTACIDTIRRHEKALDMFAEAGGMPGCLAWGCIKFVLEVGLLNEYEVVDSDESSLEAIIWIFQRL